MCGTRLFGPSGTLYRYIYLWLLVILLSSGHRIYRTVIVLYVALNSPVDSFIYVISGYLCRLSYYQSFFVWYLVCLPVFFLCVSVSLLYVCGCVYYMVVSFLCRLCRVCNFVDFVGCVYIFCLSVDFVGCVCILSVYRIAIYIHVRLSV